MKIIDLKKIIEESGGIFSEDHKNNTLVIGMEKKPNEYAIVNKQDKRITMCGLPAALSMAIVLYVYDEEETTKEFTDEEICDRLDRAYKIFGLKPLNDINLYALELREQAKREDFFEKMYLYMDQRRTFLTRAFGLKKKEDK